MISNIKKIGSLVLIAVVFSSCTVDHRKEAPSDVSSGENERLSRSEYEQISEYEAKNASKNQARDS